MGFRQKKIPELIDAMEKNRVIGEKEMTNTSLHMFVCPEGILFGSLNVIPYKSILALCEDSIMLKTGKLCVISTQYDNVSYCYEETKQKKENLVSDVMNTLHKGLESYLLMEFNNSNQYPVYLNNPYNPYGTEEVRPIYNPVYTDNTEGKS